MRRAVHHATVSRRDSAATNARSRFCKQPDPAIDAADEKAAPLPAGAKAKNGADLSFVADERCRKLAAAIIQRIESRLPGRIRKLGVHVVGDTVMLSGECATYYTKQLAQHAAMGILEDEHLENAIVVTIGR